MGYSWAQSITQYTNVEYSDINEVRTASDWLNNNITYCQTHYGTYYGSNYNYSSTHNGSYVA